MGRQRLKQPQQLAVEQPQVNASQRRSVVMVVLLPLPVKVLLMMVMRMLLLLMHVTKPMTLRRGSTQLLPTRHSSPSSPSSPSLPVHPMDPTRWGG